MNTIFVYGTLRPGASNSWRMRGAKYLGESQVAARLYRISWYPALRLDKSEANWVHGAIYEVNDELLRELDLYEGEDYRRVRTLVKTMQTSLNIQLWEYATSPNQGEWIQSGDWLKYLAENPL